MQSQADGKRRGTLVDYNILDTAQSASPDTPIDHSGVLPTPLLLFFLVTVGLGAYTFDITVRGYSNVSRGHKLTEYTTYKSNGAQPPLYSGSLKFETRRGVWQQLSHVYLQTFNTTGQPPPQLLQFPPKTLIQTGPLSCTGCIYTHTHTQCLEALHNIYFYAPTETVALHGHRRV
uniref:Uncharacterized protein n=1 Tax=Ixodes ricinus TaxID=34613 RepID=A0A0K8R9Z8_IXORI